MLMMIKIAANNAGLLPRWKIIAALSTSITAADLWRLLDRNSKKATTENKFSDRKSSICIAFLVLPMCNGRISHYSIRKKSFILWQCI
jgi:formate-dependent nitrite reductase membrane component NrfD